MIQNIAIRRQQIERVLRDFKPRRETNRYGETYTLTPEIIAERMLLNALYDPSSKYFSHWDDRCHPEYALASFQERCSRFLQVVRVYRRYILGNPHNASHSVIGDAVVLADHHKALYEDWVLAQICFYDQAIWPSQLKSRFAAKNTKDWINKGRYIPPILLLD